MEFTLSVVGIGLLLVLGGLVAVDGASARAIPPEASRTVSRPPVGASGSTPNELPPRAAVPPDPP